MARFDRFDICAAYAALEADYNVGGMLQERGRKYSVGVQLHRMGWQGGHSFDGWDSLSANAREIYNEAAERLSLGDGGYKPCACGSCFEIAIGRGRPYCHECQEAGCNENTDACVERYDFIEDDEGEVRHVDGEE